MAATKRTMRRRGQGRAPATHHGLFKLITLLSLGVALFVVLGKSVNYSSKCETLTAQMAKRRAEIKALESERQYLEMEAEELRSRKIVFSNVKRFKLALRPAKPFQVRYLNEPTIEELRMSSTGITVPVGRSVAIADTSALLAGN